MWARLLRTSAAINQLGACELRLFSFRTMRAVFENWLRATFGLHGKHGIAFSLECPKIYIDQALRELTIRSRRRSQSLSIESPSFFAVARPLLYPLSMNFSEVTQMEATKRAELAVIKNSKWADQYPSEGLRHAQSNFLSELPGVAFAVLTLVYIVSSFASLL